MAEKRDRSGPVVFVAEFMPTFELVIPVWQALKDRGVPTVVVATPRRATPFGEEPRPEHYHYDTAAELWQWLSDHGFNPLPQLPPHEEADRLRSLRPSAVFLSSPYDNLHHPDLAPQRLGLPVHYVSYLFRIGPDEFHAETWLPFYDYLDTVYAETPFERDLYLQSGLDPAKVVLAGHPGLDEWDKPHELAATPTVLWCPWWSYVWADGRRGYCTFLEGRRAMLDEVRRRPDLHVLFRPHGNLFHTLRSEKRWTLDEEQEFWDEVTSLPNMSVHVAGEVSHIDQLGGAWAMVTDGISFFCEFSYTGKPLLLTQAPGNPGWNEVGQQIEAMVEKSEVMAGLPAFLDQVEAGIDPAEVARRQNRMREILGRPEGGAAAAVADHVVRRREAVLAAREVTAPPVRLRALTDEALDEVQRLNEWVADRVGRAYQRDLISTGRVSWLGRRLALTSMSLTDGDELKLLLTSSGEDPVGFITGATANGWEIDRVIVGDGVFHVTGEEAGCRIGSVRSVLGAGTEQRIVRLREQPVAGPRTLWMGTTGASHDLWNSLPALVQWEDLIREQVATGQVRVWADPERVAQLAVTGPVAEVLPGFGQHLQVKRRVPPARTIPVGSALVTDEVRSRVIAALADVPRPAPPHGSGASRLWIGSEGPTPDNMVDVAAAVAAAWCEITGGDVVIDAFCPDDEQRHQSWQAGEIARADGFRATVASRAAALGAPAGRVLTTTGLSQREALAWASTADRQIMCSDEATRLRTWLWRTPGLFLAGPGVSRDAIGRWFSDRVEGGAALGTLDASVARVTATGWRVAGLPQSADDIVRQVLSIG